MPLPVNPIMFANNPLDRAGNLRRNPEWVRAQLTDDTALFVPMWQLSPLVLPEITKGEGRDVGWLPRPALADAIDDQSLIVFLGVNRRGKPLFAADVSRLSNPEDAGPFKGMGIFEDVRNLAAAGDMPDTELAILAQAKAMLDWNLRHGFCSQCGSLTHMAEAGYKRACPNCGAEHFPRTDPVVIMLAHHDDACLVGRQKGWPEGMFSSLAGFMEPGETIEEAVAREMQEEAGIDITSVRYLGTQPWPFPASMMIGCLAEASGRDITLDDEELEEARWISREDVRRAMNGDGPIGVPPRMAIAHQLMRAFADGEG
ncbi:MAG: NAD(+) diphosphatase [PS1 clade bacterium]|nr:NAD(+) diphosphatase [PS1 clade bacterium]CAI8298673.1 MAG: NADH pyrophosphatase [Rhodobiaceae bacterium UBA7378]HCQ81401.1 NAD(+) diphosphatase [Rhodobiaceae bacterium]